MNTSPIRKCKRLLIFCDYLSGLYDSLFETLAHIGVNDCVLVRKRENVRWRREGTRVIDLPLRVFHEDEPVGVRSVMSLAAYLIMAILAGTVAALSERVDGIFGIYAFPQGLVALFVGLVTGRRVAILTDGGDLDVFVRKSLIRPVVLACLRRATAVTALNRAKSSLLLSHGVRAPLCATIGVNTSRFEYVPLVDKERGSLLYVGRLASEKRPELLLEACRRLLQEGVQFRLLLAGDGPLRGRIDDTVNHMGLADVVVMKGYVPHSEIDQLFRKSNIFILPSAREGVSVALLEAMSSGCLCLVSDIADNRELIRNMQNGITFRSNDKEDLTMKLRWAISESSKLAFMTRNARALVEEDYSLEAVGRQVSVVLSRVTEEPRISPAESRLE